MEQPRRQGGEMGSDSSPEGTCNYHPGGNMNIALDFDGVLHDYHGWNGGKLNDPIPGALELVNELLERGAKLWVFSTRDANQIFTWLNIHGFPNLPITNKKLVQFHV